MKSIFKSFKESISYKVLLLVITDLIIPTIISIINNDNKYTRYDKKYLVYFYLYINNKDKVIYFYYEERMIDYDSIKRRIYQIFSSR